jgi:hypothetical protein
VEEKVDGANLGLSVDEDGELRAQNRGTYLNLDAPHGQFKPLRRWIDARRHQIADALYPRPHAVRRVVLRRAQRPVLAAARTGSWPSTSTTAPPASSGAPPDGTPSLASLGLALVPRLGAGRFDLRGLTALLRSFAAQ